MNQETLNLYANIVTIIGLPLAIVSIVFAILQQRQAKKVEEGTFLIELRKMFSEHNYVHFKLRNEGEWSENEIPNTPEEWGKIDAYLGLLELCEILIQNKSLSEKHFSTQYGYRLENIMNNDQIILKLRDEKESWTNLFLLFARFISKDKLQ